MSTTEVDDVAAMIATHKPDFIMVAYDHPKYTKVVGLAKALAKSYKQGEIIPFCEKDSPAFMNRLHESGFDHIVRPPLYPKGVVRTLERIINENPQKFFRNDQSKDQKTEPKLVEKGSTEDKKTSGFREKLEEALESSVDSICKIDKTSQKYSTIKYVERILCYPMKNKDMSGYLCFAAGSFNFLTGEGKDLAKDIFEYTQYNLQISGDDIELYEPFEIELNDIDFVPWSLSEGEFLKKGYHHDIEVGVAFFRQNDPYPTLPKYKEGTFLEAPIDSFIVGEITGFNVSLHLQRNQRFQIIIKEDGFLRGAQKSKLKNSGVQKLLIEETDREKFLFYYVRGYFRRLVEDYSFTSMNRELKRVLKIRDENERIRGELISAQGVQEFLFPDNHYLSDDFEVRGFYERASECGGDWWYYFVSGRKAHFWIGDATGHGLAAALVTSAARAATVVLREMPNLELEEAIGLLNNAVYAAGGGKIVMTFFMASLDLDTGELSYCNASHNFPFLFRNRIEKYRRSNVEMMLEDGGARLGERLNSSYTKHSLQLDPGDRIVFFTDGLVELEDELGRQWGERRFVQSLLQAFNSNSGITGPSQMLNSNMEEFRRSHPYVDDVTYFLVQFKPKARKIAA